MRTLCFCILSIASNIHTADNNDYLRKVTWEECKVLVLSAPECINVRFLEREVTCGSIHIVHPLKKCLDDFKGQIKQRKGHERFSFECADSLTYRSKQRYDRVIMQGTLDMVTDLREYKKGLSTCKVALKDHGMAVVSHRVCGDFSFREDIKRVLAKYTLSEGMLPEKRSFDDILHAIKEVGLTDYDFQFQEETEGFDGDSQFIFNHMDLLSDVPEAKRYNFWKEVLNRARTRGVIAVEKPISSLNLKVEQTVARMILKRSTPTPTKHSN